MILQVIKVATLLVQTRLIYFHIASPHVNGFIFEDWNGQERWENQQQRPLLVWFLIVLKIITEFSIGQWQGFKSIQSKSMKFQTLNLNFYVTGQLSYKDSTESMGTEITPYFNGRKHKIFWLFFSNVSHRCSNFRT